MPFSQHSSFAFCPAETTTSNGRGAKDDQSSYFETATSAQMPITMEEVTLHGIIHLSRSAEFKLDI